MNYRILKISLALAPVLSLASCMDFDTPSDEFTGTQTEDDVTVYHGNADKLDYHKAITEEGMAEAINGLTNDFMKMTTASYYMKGGKNGGMPGAHQYQYEYSLHLDNYAGYFTADQNWGGRLVSTGTYYRDFLDGPYGSYKEIRNYLGGMLNNPLADSIPEIKAVALLLFDFKSQEVVDIYGAVPYSDFKANKQDAPFTFQPGMEIYATIIDNLDSINACLKHFDQRPSWYKDNINMILSSTGADVITYEKTVDSWRRFANSLKLRMAMRSVKVFPDKAKKWAEEAVAEGVVSTTDQEIALSTRTNFFSNPIIEIASSWGDTRLNASMETVLMSLDHPFLKYVFTNNSSDIVNTKTGEILPADTRIVGLRAGLEMMAGQTAEVNPRCAYSQFKLDDWDNWTFSAMGCAPLYYVKVSEMEFLRAEGAVRGWNMGGDARTFYEQGIRHAQLEDRDLDYVQYYRDYVEDYLQKESATPYTYRDPMDSANDAQSLTTIGVKWNDSDTPETKLEKIITQKWIALYPYSNEAWAELRRTGYPKIFPVLNLEDFSDGSLFDGDLIRRIPLPGSGSSEGDADITNTGLDALGGPDVQATRVWWDVEEGNF